MADKRKVTVYGIVHKDDPDHIRYIGQTTNLISRKACHRQLTKNGSNTCKKMPNRKPFSDEYKKEHSQRMKLWWKMRKESANG